MDYNDVEEYKARNGEGFSTEHKALNAEDIYALVGKRVRGSLL